MVCELQYILKEKKTTALKIKAVSVGYSCFYLALNMLSLGESLSKKRNV